MTKLKSSDLPPQVRQHLLDQIKQQIGSTKYFELVDQFGEDGLIDRALEMAGSLPPAVKKKKIPWGTIFYIAFAVALVGCLFNKDLRGVAVVCLLCFFGIPLIRIFWEIIMEKLFPFR